MKKILTAIFVMSLMNIIFAQMHGGNNMTIDSISVSGTAIVDSTTYDIPIYYLDVDGDGVADYHLNFGPFWYQPDSSNAVRPFNGDNISIAGGLHDSNNMSAKTIIVFEINGEFWRNPFFADWNGMGDHRGGMMGGGFGWQHDTVTTVTISGTALVDTTYFMHRYYLDTNSDGTPDYNLNFGPFWFQPASGAVRPTDGDQIEIIGGKLNTTMDEPMIIVYKINGQIWRDSSTIGSHFGGGWFHSDMTGSMQFHSPFDNLDQMTINEGWENGGMMGGGMNNYDSLFCQILETYPENIPNIDNMNILAGYEIHLLDSDGKSAMNNGGMMGGHMEFDSNVSYQMHYTDAQLDYYNADENSIEAKYWDNQSNSWIKVNATINTESNTVTFDNNIVSNFVVLTSNNITAANNPGLSTPNKFKLEQNYPNPFNPTTVIQFSLNNEANVTLTIYNILGEKITQLITKKMNAGTYSVNFNAENLPSGIYFYELKTGFASQVKKMNLIK